jgi:uncharacterized protein (TIGR03083 family)
MDAAAERVTLVHRESTRLTHYLHSLPQEAWSQPSACAQWQVQDVVTHLLGGAELYAGSIARGLQGDTSPPEGYPPAGTVTAAVRAEDGGQHIIARRQQLGHQVLGTFEAANQALNRLLAAVSASEWETPCYHPGGLFPVRWFRDARLGELVIHGWDIRSRFESDAPLSPESLPVLLDVCAALTPGWAFWPGAPLATPVRYRCAVTGVVSATMDIIVAGDKVRIDEASDVPPDVTFRCEAETYVLVRYGRLRLADALATGRVVAEGDQAVAVAFGQWFKGI